MSPTEVVIVGGGIVGLSAGLELQARGNTVAIVDRDDSHENASLGNGGVISRSSILAVANPAVWRKALRYAANRDLGMRIRYASLPYIVYWLKHFIGCCNEAAFRRVAQALNPFVASAYDHHVRLAQLTGTRGLIKRNGMLKLFRRPASFAATRLEQEILSDAGIQVCILQSDEIRDLEPALMRSFSHALFFPESGSVDSPRRLLEGYRKAFCDRGGSLIPGTARHLEYGPEFVTVHLGDRTVSARHAVIAAGAWSPRLIAPLRYRVPVIAERGYHAHFDVRDNITLNRPILDPDGCYAAAPMEGTVRVMSGIELARPDDPPDFSQLDAVIAEARGALPLAEMRSNSRWLGSRPSTADSLPVIGRAPRHPRLLLAFGHGHIGFATGPITGRIIADLVHGLPPPVPIEPFAIERHSH